ncbi:MAG: hypothetical protein ACE5KQ_07490, partial [Thermoplasmata archaeon]
AYRAVKSFQSEVEATKLAGSALVEDESVSESPEAEMPESREPVEAGEAMPEEAAMEGPAAQSQVACPRCGSISVEVGPRRKAQCQSCGKKFRAR